jgi:hypothetical protein
VQGHYVEKQRVFRVVQAEKLGVLVRKIGIIVFDNAAWFKHKK